MSIFSLAKGGKEHEVFEMRMLGGEVLNSYISRIITAQTKATEPCIYKQNLIYHTLCIVLSLSRNKSHSNISMSFFQKDECPKISAPSLTCPMREQQRWVTAGADICNCKMLL